GDARNRRCFRELAQGKEGLGLVVVPSVLPGKISRLLVPMMIEQMGNRAVFRQQGQRLTHSSGIEFPRAVEVTVVGLDGAAGVEGRKREERGAIGREGWATQEAR